MKTMTVTHFKYMDLSAHLQPVWNLIAINILKEFSLQQFEILIIYTKKTLNS